MEYDRTRYKILSWKNFMMLHWVINPGLAVIELILGQRVPKVMLIEKGSDKPLIDKTVIPCPHCSTLHNGRTWSVQNKTAFKNWFGLYCPSCGGVIPCLTNALSFIILAVTFPLWGWFRKPLKAAWLAKQPERYRNLNLSFTTNPADKKTWLTSGLAFSGMMFLFNEVAFPLLDEGRIYWLKFFIGIPVWLLAGLLFGLTMRKWAGGVAGQKQEG